MKMRDAFIYEIYKFLFYFLTGELQLRFTQQIQFFRNLVFKNKIDPRKQEFPKSADKTCVCVGGRGR